MGMKKFSRSNKQGSSGKRSWVIPGLVILLACMVVAVVGFFSWESFQEPDRASVENDEQALADDEDSQRVRSNAIYRKIERKQPNEPAGKGVTSSDPGETPPRVEPSTSAAKADTRGEKRPAPAHEADRSILDTVAKTGPAPSSSPLNRDDPDATSRTSPPETGVAPGKHVAPDAAPAEKAPPSSGVEETLRLAVDVGRVRSQPSLSSSIAFLLKKGAVVTVRERADAWLRIDAGDNRLGWARQDLFEKTGGLAGAATGREVKRITVESERPDEERIIVALNGKHLPKTFSLAGENPRLVSDFFDARLASGVARNLPVNGAYIRRIRVGIHHGETPRVRVVADLSPGRDYDVKQFFFDESATFVLVLKSEEQPQN